MDWTGEETRVPPRREKRKEGRRMRLWGLDGTRLRQRAILSRVVPHRLFCLSCALHARFQKKEKRSKDSEGLVGWSVRWLEPIGQFSLAVEYGIPSASVGGKRRRGYRKEGGKKKIAVLQAWITMITPPPPSGTPHTSIQAKNRAQRSQAVSA